MYFVSVLLAYMYNIADKPLDIRTERLISRMVVSYNVGSEKLTWNLCKSSK